MWKNTLILKKLPHVLLHGLQGFLDQNIEGESMEANDLIVTLCCSGSVAQIIPDVAKDFTKLIL